MKRILNMNKIAKKSIILISFLVLNLPVFSEVTSSIEVKEVIASPSTGIDHPGNYLIDGDSSTSWGFSSETTSGWAEIELIKPVHIFGIKLDSQLPDDVEMELSYKKDGQFYPFSGGKIKNGINDESIIDLSFDNIVADNIKISLSGSNLNGSLINEMDIIGEYSDEVFYKINPVTIEESENDNPFFPAKNLVDGNTKTGWRTDNSNELPAYNSLIKPFLDKKSDGYWDSEKNQGSGVLFELAGLRKLDKLKVYLKENRIGQLSIEARIHEEWIEIVNIPPNSHWGWLTYPLENIQTDKIRLLIDGSTGNNVEISEIEFWGYGDYTGDEVILLTNLSDNVETEGYIFHCDLENDKPYYFEIETADQSGASQINYELNGKELVGDKVVSNGYSTIYRTFIEPSRIYTFDNVIKVPNMDNLDKVVMRVCRADGLFRIGFGPLSDSFFLTPNTGSGTINWNLSQSINIERMELYSDRLADSQISTNVDGTYTPLSIMEKNEYRTVFEGREEVQQIRYNDYNNSGFSELNILGCLTNIGPVSTKLFNRETDYDANDSAIYQFLLLGTIDDENAKVLINGIEALQEGYYFWLPITTLGLGSEDSTELVIKTVLPSGEETTQNIQFTAVAGKVDKFDIDLEITGDLDNRVVNNPYVNIEGNISGYGELFIYANGNPGSISNNRFSIFGCPIVEGKNSITVRASNRYNKVVTKTITVVRDTVDPVFGSITPGDNHIFSTSSIKFTGQIFDHNLKDVVVDGKEAVLNGDNYTISFNLVDGFYNLPIKATDLAGNEQDGGFLSFAVDTRIPEPFTPGSSSTGWTKSYPEITFSATDATSGIDYYQISVAGSDFKTVTSPYRITEIPEGKQVVIVKAVDKAGHIQAGSVTVLIDTVSPEQPVINRIIPGNNQVELDWYNSDSDIEEYTITRYPEWENGSVVISELNFIDELAVNGTEYIYSITSIDRAGNKSEENITLPVTSGIASIDVIKESENTILYENVEISFEEEAIADNIKKIEIVEIENQFLQDKAVFSIVSPIYEFKALDENNESSSYTKFNKPFKASITYTEDSIPEGIPEDSIGVYYFDSIWGEWFLVEDCAVDTVDNKVYFSTDHFTPYALDIVPANPLTPKDLQDSGYSPFHSYSKQECLSISPQSGNVYTEFTDLVIPGGNGLDIVIKRRYDTLTAKMDSIVDFSDEEDGVAKGWLENRCTFLNDQFSTGLGWRLDFPAFYKGTFSNMLLLPGGRRISLKTSKLISVEDMSSDRRKLFFEVHDGNDILMEVTQKYYEASDYYQTTAVRVILKDGIIYYFEDGKLCSIEDPKNPDNKLSFRSDNKIYSITGNAINNEIELRYQSGHIKSIHYKDNQKPESDEEPTEGNLNGQITYSYDDGYLSSVTDAGKREWKYDYETKNFDKEETYLPIEYSRLIEDTSHTWVKIEDRWKQPGSRNHPILGENYTILKWKVYNKECHFDNGYSSEYKCETKHLSKDQRKEIEERLEKPFYITSAKLLNIVSGPGIGTTKLSYSNEGNSANFRCSKVELFNIPYSTDLDNIIPEKTTTYIYDERYSTVSEDNYITECIETSGDRQINYYYTGYEDTPDEWEIEDDNTITYEPAEDSYYLTYQSSKETYDLSTGVLQDKLVTEYDTDKMRLTSSKIWRSDNNYNKNEYKYDTWGNVTYEGMESFAHGIKNQKETYNYYLNPEDTAKSTLPDNTQGWDIPYSKSELTLPVSLDKPRYNLLLASISTNYSPEIETENPLVVKMGTSPEYFYTYLEYNSLGQNTGISRYSGLIQNNDDENDDLEWLKTTNTYYNYTETDIITLDTGLKVKPLNNGLLATTTNPADHETSFSYEYLDNDMLATLVSSDVKHFVTTITNKDVEDADENIKDIKTKTSIDMITGWKEWEQSANDFNTDRKISYEYDELGRETKIIQPDGNTVSICYNPPTQEKCWSEVVNENGSKTRYEYRYTGELEKIIKYLRVKDENGEYKEPVKYLESEIVMGYDESGNISSITDPLTNMTKYEYDSMNRNSKVTYPDNTQQSSSYYDYSKNISFNTDEEGNETEIYYDMFNRAVKTVQHDNNNEIIAQNYYDSNGNVVFNIDPNGNITRNEYNCLNQLVKTTLPGPSTEYPYYENNVEVTDSSNSPFVSYIYDKAGFLDQEVKNTADGELTIDYTVNGLGQKIKTETTCSVFDPETKTSTPKTLVEKEFYDDNGNRTKFIDSKNSQLGEDERKILEFRYDTRNRLVREINQDGFYKLYNYDNTKNISDITELLGNIEGKYSTLDFEVEYEYDDLDRLVKGILPKRGDQPEKPEVVLEYDLSGNLKKRTEADGKIIEYKYTSRNWLEEEKHTGDGIIYIISYDYYKNGALWKRTDPGDRVTEHFYDNLGREVKIKYPEGNTVQYEYDNNGNKTVFIDGEDNRTEYLYDSQNRISKEIDASYDRNEQKFYYDRWGNKTRTIDKDNRIYTYEYDELNRVIKETNPLNFLKVLAYDELGNIVYTKDANGVESDYEYSSTNLLEAITLNKGGETLSLTYDYDEAGNIKSEENGDVVTRYNTIGDVYTPDPYSYINNTTQVFNNNKNYTVSYKYDINGLMTSVTSPDNEEVQYEYNKHGELLDIPGYLDGDRAPQYNNSGLLEQITAKNKVVNSTGFDDNGRLEDLKYSFSETDIFHNTYLYDLNSNISSKTDQVKSYTDSYEYDRLNQIKVAELQGKFDYKTQTEDRTVGIVTDDVLGDKSIEEIIVDNETISLDYRAGSIVADLQQEYPVTRVLIDPDQLDNRVEKKNLSIFFSSDNITYTEIPEWEYIRNDNGSIGLIFPTSIETRYIKVHSHFNNRDNDYNAINDSTFSARAKDIIQVYYTISTKTEKYDYDASGNRILKETTIHSPRDQFYRYYPNSDRLMTDGTFVYQYDKNGNLLKKGEVITNENVSINISDVDKEYWENVTSSIDSLSISPKGNYWEYDFDLLNQLTTVRKYDISTNSLETMAEYIYDSKGNRVLKNGKKKEIFIFNQNGQILYEEICDKDTSVIEESSTYVYALGKHFARIEKIEEFPRAVSYYHTDHLGSVIAVTDETGGLLWSNEYETFGGLSSSFNTYKHANKYTGKDFDEDTGLYYFNARWYDPELGRFITEDPIKDGVSWYVYCGNNPLVFVDPTGLFIQTAVYNSDFNTWSWNYEVQTGDTCWDLGNDYYNDGDYGSFVATMNQWQNPDLIYPGVVFNIPMTYEERQEWKLRQNDEYYLYDASFQPQLCAPPEIEQWVASEILYLDGGEARFLESGITCKGGIASVEFDSSFGRHFNAEYKVRSFESYGFNFSFGGEGSKTLYYREGRYDETIEEVADSFLGDFGCFSIGASASLGSILKTKNLFFDKFSISILGGFTMGKDKSNFFSVDNNVWKGPTIGSSGGYSKSYGSSFSLGFAICDYYEYKFVR